jgi:hypothetical protein
MLIAELHLSFSAREMQSVNLFLVDACLVSRLINEKRGARSFARMKGREGDTKNSKNAYLRQWGIRAKRQAR